MYVALLRAHQPTCKELIRAALDKLTRSLPTRLPSSEQIRVVKWSKKIIVRRVASIAVSVVGTAQLRSVSTWFRREESSFGAVWRTELAFLHFPILSRLCLQLEEGHVLPQLAHVFGLVSRLPQMFTPHQKQFAPQISNSLAKLCLPSNCSVENRELAIGAWRRRPHIACR